MGGFGVEDGGYGEWKWGIDVWDLGKAGGWRCWGKLGEWLRRFCERGVGVRRSGGVFFLWGDGGVEGGRGWGLWVEGRGGGCVRW